MIYYHYLKLIIPTFSRLVFRSSQRSVKYPRRVISKTMSFQRSRPNYFVAVQVSDPQIHESVKEIQQHISNQDDRFNDCMIPISTLHITLMVMNISDLEMHERAKKALAKVCEEYSIAMCENPLVLEFCGLGHFNNKVLYGKIKESDSYARLLELAQGVQRHFTEYDILSTDERDICPHLTIAKMNFADRHQRALREINASLYSQFLNNYLGSETIRSIQLLSMNGSKDSNGYYTGDELFFHHSSSSCLKKEIKACISEKKQKVKEMIAEATKNAFKQDLNTKRKN